MPLDKCQHTKLYERECFIVCENVERIASCQKHSDPNLKSKPLYCATFPDEHDFIPTSDQTDTC